MTKLTRTSKYSDLRQGLDNENKAYFDHLKKIEEQKRLQEQTKQTELEKQNIKEVIKQEEVLNVVEETKEEKPVKKEDVSQELQEAVNKDAKRKPIFSYILICLFIMIMVTSTIMWKKGFDNNKPSRVDNDNLALYKYYDDINGYLNISKLDCKFIENNEYKENNVATSYIQVVNKSNETQKYNVVIKIDDPNGVASNYEYAILVDGSIENNDLQQKDFGYILAVSNYGGSFIDLTQEETLSNTLLIQNGILNKGDSKSFIIYIYKIDDSIQDDIDIDLLVLS